MIYDEDAELSESMRMYWERKGLVKVEEKISTSTISTFVKESGPSEWNQEGIKYFEQQKYEQVNLPFKPLVLRNN